MRRAYRGNYEIDDDPARIDPAAAVSFLTTEAYWGRWRGEQEIRRQIAAAWRVVGRLRPGRRRWSASPAPSATADPPTSATCTCCPPTAAPAWAGPSSR